MYCNFDSHELALIEHCLRHELDACQAKLGDSTGSAKFFVVLNERDEVRDLFRRVKDLVCSAVEFERDNEIIDRV